MDTVELRKGTPFHNDIKFTWPFPTTKAISTCKYKCDRLSPGLKDEYEDNLKELPKEGEIFLYHAKYFEGNYFKISEYPDKCVNMTDEWEGLVESVRVGGNNTCAHLFDRRDCTGESVMIYLGGSVEDLGRMKFDGRTRSIKGCSEIENSFSRLVKDKQQQRVAGEGTGNGSSSHVGITVTILIVVGIVVGGGAVVLVMKSRKINLRSYENNLGVWPRIRECFGGRGGWSGFRNGDESGVMRENERDAYNDNVFDGGNGQGGSRSGNGFDLLA